MMISVVTAGLSFVFRFPLPLAGAAGAPPLVETASATASSVSSCFGRLLRPLPLEMGGTGRWFWVELPEFSLVGRGGGRCEGSTVGDAGDLLELLD